MAEYTEEQLKDLGYSANNLSKIIQNQAKKTKATAEQEARIFRDKVRETRQEINNLKKSNPLRKVLHDALEDQIDSYRDLKKGQDKNLETLHKLTNSFHGLGKAAFEGEGSISAFTENIRGLGFIGKRLDTNLETFRQLSQTGASFGQSLVTMREAAHDAALPLDDFAKLIQQNATSITAMFGSTTEGAKRLAELGRITREVGIKRLAPLGFTVDEINETLLLNLDSQRRTGIFDRMTTKQRTQSAINFAEQLDRLAKLTGQQRDELRKEIEQQQSNEKFAIAMQNQTDETRQRLQGFAATVGNIAPGLNEGFQDLIANAGVPVTESALSLIQNIPEASGVIRRLIAGTITAEQALGQIREASIKSMDRFGKVTVTGQVEFTRFQGDVIALGRRIVDVNGVYKDQNATVSSLVKNLTSFEQASKVLSSQFQGIETGMLQAFGPALGGLISGIQNIMGASGSIALALAKAPALSAALMVAGLAGKFLFPKAIQVMMIAKGVEIGTRMADTGRGMMSSIFGKSKGGAGGKGGGFGKFARSGLGKTVGYTGLAMSGMSAVGGLTDDDKSNDWSAYGSIGGAVLGGILGSFAGPGGTLLGASLGSMAGQFAGGLAQNAFGGDGKQKRSSGTLGATGQPFEPNTGLLHVDQGETVLNKKDAKAYDKFSTEALETKMTSMIGELNSANKTLATTLSSVNTLVAIESRSLRANEKLANRDLTQVGLV